MRGIGNRLARKCPTFRLHDLLRLMADSDMLNADVEALLALKRKWSERRNVERCELCSRALDEGHPHLVDSAARRILCCCEPCALLFDGRPGARYGRIAREPAFLEGFAIDDAVWNSLSIPINLAFFFFSSAARKTIAMFPSPAGATESELPEQAWKDIADRCPRLQQLRPDIEAVLVNRLGRSRESYLVPIDLCYELTGLIRKHWTGFSGGESVWREVDAFFDRLRCQCGRAGAEHARASL
jgi:Family of unknown function (DUF5947)